MRARSTCWTGINVPPADEATKAGISTLDDDARVTDWSTAAAAFLSSGQVYLLGDMIGFVAMRSEKLAPDFDYNLVNNGGVTLASLKAAEGT